ncbi:MAG: SUMF1/EgtB/PvdO family nonheme iron enzyme [Gammaproteobacteria bacterium]|nr:SUMF1/EgtB/PvdO family nonheme iron enzyme [Gammaproteobacteria bacterium]MCP5459592.1 SUMF1/EgtB/PvdO family nonheme iron enzyme [Gammaproteobacteria bacterium]
MDAKGRFKQLQEVYTAGHLENAEFNELRAALLSIMHRTIPVAEGSAPIGIEESDAPLPALSQLQRDLEIGPPARRFRLMRRLGDGCAAYQTWLGTDLNVSGNIDERLWALKIFAPPPSATNSSRGSTAPPLDAYLTRIKIRVELATLLNHPCIAKVYGWRRDKAGWLFAESEYIDHRTSQSLEKLLEAQGKPGLSWGHALELIRPVIAALTYAQREHRLAHRNLKPATLFRTEQDTLKIVDFALNAQTRETDENPGMTGRAEPLLLTTVPSVSGQSRFKRDVSDLCAAILQLLTGHPWTVEAQRPKLARLTKPSQLSDNAWQLLRHSLAGHETCPASADELLQRLETAQTIPDAMSGEPLLTSRALSTSGLLRTSRLPGATGPQDELYATLLYNLSSGMEIGPPDHRFRLLRRLGDTGRVWLVADLKEQRVRGTTIHKALKIFAPATTKELEALVGAEEGVNPTRAEMLTLRAALVHLRAKVEVAVLLKHPNIIRVYGWRQGKDGWPFVEMDYLDNRSGYNLQQLLQREGPLTWERALSLLHPIASALDYAHQTHRLPHRNLKPSNVVVTHDDNVKLMDFGLTYQPRDLREGARARDAEEAKSENGGEQAASALSFKQDIGALAALAYEMLSGKPPFADEILLGRDPHTWPPLSGERNAEAPRKNPVEPNKPPGLNEAAWQIIRHSLDYRDEECPTSAGELLRRLEAAQTPRRLSRNRGKTDRVAASNWPRWRAAVLSLAILAAASAYGLYAWYPRLGVQGTLSEQPGRPSPSATTATNHDPLRPEDSSAVADAEADRQAFEAARRLASVSAYRIYLQRCPKCGFKSEAEKAIVDIDRREELATLTAQLETYLAAWQRNEGQHADRSAKAVLDKLAAVAPQLPLIADGRHRLALSYAQRAEQSIAAGEFKAAQQWLDAAKAMQANLPELQILPQALAQAQAQAQQRQVQASARGKDDAAFQQAQNANNRQAYLAYLTRCAPQCAHKQEANGALEALKLQPPSASNPIFRDRLDNGGLGPEMVFIPAGEFWIGSPPDEAGRYADEIRQTAKIPRPFGLSEYEITFDEYDAFANATRRAQPDDEGWGRGRQPVINVTWEDAQAYTQWLSQRTGKSYRLPTEAEWEYAARAGTTQARFWGDDPNAGCRFANGSDLTAQQTYAGWTAMRCQDGYLHSAPVGSYQPNAWGLHDMLGNVMELTCSAYDAHHRAPISACSATASVSHLVARGGSWSDEPSNMRSAERFKATPDMKANYLGFRVLREL